MKDNTPASIRQVPQYRPHLGVWASPDPLAIHGIQGDLNPYAYVRGRAFAATDYAGLGDNDNNDNNDRSGWSTTCDADCTEVTWTYQAPRTDSQMPRTDSSDPLEATPPSALEPGTSNGASLSLKNSIPSYRDFDPWANESWLSGVVNRGTNQLQNDRYLAGVQNDIIRGTILAEGCIATGACGAGAAATEGAFAWASRALPALGAAIYRAMANLAADEEGGISIPGSGRSQVARNYAGGRIFQNRAGEAIKQTENFDLLNGAPINILTRPDWLTQAVVGEGKSGAYLYYTSQIQAQINAAIASGRTYVIITGMQTGASGPLLDAMKSTNSIMMRFDPLTGLFTAWW